MSAKEIQLKPHEVLFEEGDQSQNLYFLKKGIIRIFKRKAEGNIEIETIRQGQVIGEMAFFDGQPRSASAEALTTCDLIEMSRTALDEALSKFPDWLVALTKTVSTRLRASNNRIRLLESLSTEFETDKQGNRSRDYVYLTTADVLKFSTALLAVASRYGKNATMDGIEFSSGMLEKFAGQMLQISSSKVVSLMELFKSVDILKGDLFLTDIRFLDQLLMYLNEQNMLAPEKKQRLSLRGFEVLKIVVQNRTKAVAIADPVLRLNIAPYLKGTNLQPTHLQELLAHSFLKNILISSAEEILVDFDGSRNVFLYRTFWLLTELEKLNETKRRGYVPPVKKE
ncbi:MAG: Crp/Fnr family transcriptional regulator [Bdellovibrionales bacterium]|nr:Crp/Fnr family transcriptional regulator [Oligoflexia bacterium]